ncbi:MAG: Rossmann-like domain-containing protein [Chloroflexota bacterium]
MSLLRDLISSVREDASVRSILVGVHWVVVCSRSCGMAAAIRADHPHGAPDVRDAGNLLSRSARELAELAFSASPLEAGIGVAALNSLLAMDESQAVEINAAQVLAERGKDRNVALIGSFPFIPQLRQAVGQLWVIEQRPAQGEYPAEAAPDLLPRADLVAITSSSLVNGTFDGLLALCPPRATVMLLGPSTPLSPIVFDYGIDIMSGTRIVDAEAVLRTVGQGASFRQVEGVRLLTFARPVD